MSGITDSESSSELYRLLLKDYPISSDLKNLDMMPGRSTELQTFKSAAVEGHADRIHKLTMARLDAGDASLVVEGSEGETQLSEGRVVGVRAPPDCLPRFELLQSLSFTVTSVTVTQKMGFLLTVTLVQILSGVTL